MAHPIPPLQLASSLESFISRPIGTYFATKNSIVWCASEALCGSHTWGTPDPDDTRLALAAFEGMAALAERFVVVMDASLLDSAPPACISLVIAWAQAHRAVCEKRIALRVSIVYPNVLGLALAGIAPLFGDFGNLRICTDASAGFRLALPHGDAAGLQAIIDGLVDKHRAESQLLARLREVLSKDPGKLDIVTASRRIACSTRSLQRTLREQGTTFSNEQDLARLRFIESRMVDADCKLSAVAAELGLTDGGLVALVRRLKGESPSALRDRIREQLSGAFSAA